jgi:Protein of unknown function (DUF3141)
VILEPNPPMAPHFNYIRDAFERSVLFLDVLRQRGNDYLEQSSRTAPHVLNFEFKLLVDGRTLPKPVNYALVEIVPPADVTIAARFLRRCRAHSQVPPRPCGGAAAVRSTWKQG